MISHAIKKNDLEGYIFSLKDIATNKSKNEYLS